MWLQDGTSAAPRQAVRWCVWFGLLCALALGPLGCGEATLTKKEFQCEEDRDCERSQSCQQGKCVLVDVDGDGWAKNKDCDDNNKLVYPGAPEICANLIDDNCDGSIDEDPCRCEDGKQRKCGFDQGTCRQGIQTCKNGQWGSCEGSVDPKEETCDGQDNDCDGSIDEDIPNCCKAGETKPCGDAKGECQPGTQTCNAGQWSVCTGSVGGSDEVCDGKDNDCDGKIDNIQGEEKPLTQTCYGGNPETRKKGACTDGVQTCKEGQWGDCENEIRPTDELCNGKDDDCDGQVDNVKGEDRPLKRDCYNGAPGTEGKGPCRKGQQTCIGGKWSVCQGEIVPIPESCNDVDDDCDGTTDNKQGSPSPLAQPCYSGPKDTRQKGLCQDGTQQCKSGRWSACQGDVLPKQEDCNGKDDDCDGRIDNQPGKLDPLQGSCYSGPVNTRGNAPCKDGTRSCNQGKWTACVGEVTPGTEVCDGNDNDCDGKVDDGNPGGGGNCKTNLPGVCGLGTLTCTQGKLTCTQSQPSRPEICDGNDNDCDGAVDEGDPGGGNSCTLSNKLGLCRAGQRTCKNGSLQCVQITFPLQEQCNGKDDNCNGTTDDNASCNRGSECRNGSCLSCSQPETKCPGYTLFCTGNAPDPPCRCGLRPTCIESSASPFASCAKKKCL